MEAWARRVVKEQLYELEWREDRHRMDDMIGTMVPKGSGPDLHYFRVLAADATDALSCVPAHAEVVKLRLLSPGMNIVVASEVAITQEPRPA
jgi:hypothetical protein